jgi:predicted AAA+ superfamily ATPase
MQNPEVYEKASNNAYKKKEIITPSGKTIILQGYEPQAYKILLETYKEEEILHSRKDVPEIWWVDDKGKRHRYFVDFYVPKDNLMIEVKSTRTYSLEKTREKIEKSLIGSKEAGYTIELWILDEKGNILEKKV